MHARTTWSGAAARGRRAPAVGMALLLVVVSAGCQLVRVSVATGGAQGVGESGRPSVSFDGRFVAFESVASNLVPGDTNGVRDVFVHDRVTGVTTRASVATGGAQGDGGSWTGSISGDGRYLALTSAASTLVPGDTNEVNDVFVHDRYYGTTIRASVTSDGMQAGDHSADAMISADGRSVAFASIASDLVPGDANGDPDVFVHDRVTGTTSRVSVAADGSEPDYDSESPSISGDGRYVSFTSFDPGLVPGDGNGTFDVFVRDRVAGTTSRVSVASTAAEADGQSGYSRVSTDGRYVVFRSYASNLVVGDTNDEVDVFVHDRTAGTTPRASVPLDGTEADGRSDEPTVSGDGRYVAFRSDASNLITGDTNDLADVFLRPRTG